MRRGDFALFLQAFVAGLGEKPEIIFPSFSMHTNNSGLWGRAQVGQIEQVPISLPPHLTNLMNLILIHLNELPAITTPNPCLLEQSDERLPNLAFC